MSLEFLKKNRNQEQQKLIEELNKMNKRSFDNDDENFWKPTRDKAGNGYALIRFLPSIKGESNYIKYWDHGFKGPTGLWYIEKSLTSINEPDPLYEYNGKLYNSGIEANKEIANKQKRRLNFVSNIYVINDGGNPANNGKVFYYKYGKKIFEKINDLLVPQFPGEKPINPFDLWDGANFQLRIRTGDGGFPNYDKSKFDNPEQLASDEELEKIYSQVGSLNKFLDRSKFKTYDELSAKLNRVLGTSTTTAPTTRAPTSAVSSNDEDDDAPWTTSNDAAVAEDEDEFEFFKKLANN